MPGSVLVLLAPEKYDLLSRAASPVSFAHPLFWVLHLLKQLFSHYLIIERDEQAPGSKLLACLNLINMGLVGGGSGWVIEQRFLYTFFTNPSRIFYGTKLQYE